MHPPALHPPAAEVAATALSGTGRARLATAAHPGVDVLHARTADGSVVLLAGAADVRALGLPCGFSDTADDVPAHLDVTCYAPLPDLTLPRAVLHASGTLRAAAATEALTLLRSQCLAADFGSAFRAWPDARLLLLDLVSLDLHWSFGCAPLDPVEVAASSPDPLAAGEAEALDRVATELGGRLVPLVRAMAHAHGASADEHTHAAATSVSLESVSSVRAVGMDRCGVVLRCEGAVRPDDDTSGAEPQTATIRLTFPTPVTDVDAALDALALMALSARSCAGRCPYV